MANIIPVTDPHLPGLEYYTTFTEVQLARLREPDPGIFIAESAKVLLRALDAGYTPVSLLMEERLAADEAGMALIRRCEQAPGSEGGLPFPVYTAPYDLLKDLVGYHLTGGVLCAMNRRPLPNVADVVAGASRIAILENVVNPTNIGAIFRSAAALNIDAVLLTLACCDPLYRRAIRVSMGNVFLVPWTYLRPLRRRGVSDNHWEGLGETAAQKACPDRSREAAGCAVPLSGEAPGVHREEVCGSLPDSGIEQTPASPDRQGWPSPWLARLKDMVFTTVAMALCDDSVSISDPRLKSAGKLAIVLGTEGDGLLTRTIADCDFTARIPMSAGVDSLNVAAASAVAFWELGKR